MATLPEAEPLSGGPVEKLLACLVQVIGRVAVTPATILEIVGAGSAKQLKAYNLCNGTMLQTEVARKVGLDPGNFSRSSGWPPATIAEEGAKEGAPCYLTVVATPRPSS